MSSTRNPGRVAGFIYLLLVLTGPFNLIYIPHVFLVPGNASATANNIVAHEALFRLGIVSGLVEAVIFTFVALALYRLLKGVDQKIAAVMVIFVLISAAIRFVNELNNLAALILVRSGDFFSILEKPQRDAFAMLFLRLHGQGNVANEIFWGLWLLPLAILVYRSRFLPRFLGVWLVINGFAYMIMSFTGLLLPQYQDKLFTILQPALFGEVALVLWLVVKGAHPPTLDAAASSSPAS